MVILKEKLRILEKPDECQKGIISLPKRVIRTKTPRDYELTANALFKAHWGQFLYTGFILSVVFHFLFIRYSPEWTTKPPKIHAGVFEVIDVPPEVIVPPPPAMIAKPAIPVEATEDPAEDVTIADTTPEASIIAEIATAEETSDIPTFTPYDTPPHQITRGDIDYPELLRKAGIEGVVYLWLKIGPKGNVVISKVFKSSGNVSLDEAGRRGMLKANFTPAYQRDTPVTVWVQWPVKFKLKD